MLSSDDDHSRPFFVVGCPRSGTTLLRMMLDGHPRLAIPDESHFVLGLAPRWWVRRRVVLDDLLRHPKVLAWDVDPGALAAEARTRHPRSYAEQVAAVFSAYARLRGKSRWGDKTPGYVSHVETLARLFPDAQFVHVIRDGREVARSLSDWSWGSRTAITGAFWWAHKVRVGRRVGRRLGRDRYVEVRFDALLARPEDELRRLCSFLGESYSEEMLDYPDRLVGDRRPIKAQDLHLVEPPTPGLREWRAGLSTSDQRAVEQVCRRTLRELGYQVGPSSLPAWVRALVVRGGDLAVTGWSDVRARLSPATREF